MYQPPPQNASPSPKPISNRKLRKPHFVRAQQAWKNLRATFSVLEDSNLLRYQRVLGLGGFGLVQLWQMYKADGSPDRNVAVKITTAPGQKSRVESMKNEIWWSKASGIREAFYNTLNILTYHELLQLFKGCEHLVQLVDIPDDIAKAMDINNEFADTAPIMIMEELGRGSLYDLLTRMVNAVRTNILAQSDYKIIEYIPSRVLWRIFLCLTRACIGMAYPPVLDGSDQSTKIRETVKPGMVARKIVHMDIDPQNIFVSELDTATFDAEHSHVPVVKIADYGCMTEWHDEWDDRTKLSMLWGKHDYKAPEQFDSNRALTPNAIGTQTNIWGIGITMYNLISHRYIRRNTREARYRLVLNGTSMVRTYGWRLLASTDEPIIADYRNADLELRELAARCMCEDPWQRPTLSELHDRCIANINKGNDDAVAAAMGLFPGSLPFVPGAPPPNPFMEDESYTKRRPLGQPEPDELLVKFYRDYFLDAPPVTDPYEDYWSKPPVPDEEEPPPLIVPPPPPPAALVHAQSVRDESAPKDQANTNKSI
ncbi:kinase-like protein [Xylariaceae sp. FL1651]|nr:kinase-like protein [Xylariaceae sp. FL1651]